MSKIEISTHASSEYEFKEGQVAQQSFAKSKPDDVVFDNKHRMLQGQDIPISDQPKPAAPVGLNLGDVDAADADLQSNRGRVFDSMVNPAVDMERFKASVKHLPKEEQERWLSLLSVLEGVGVSGGLSEAGGLPESLETPVALLKALMLLLVEMSAGLKKTQRDASFSSMRLAVEHLFNEAGLMRKGANVKFGTAMAGGAVSIAGTSTALYKMNTDLKAAGIFEKDSTIWRQNIQKGADPNSPEMQRIQPDFTNPLSTQSVSIKAQSIGQLFNSVGQIGSQVGDFVNTKKIAEGKEESAESQEDSFDQEQLKAFSNSSQDLISNTLNNLGQFISTYKSAIDHTSNNIV